MHYALISNSIPVTYVLYTRTPVRHMSKAVDFLVYCFCLEATLTWLPFSDASCASLTPLKAGGKFNQTSKARLAPGIPPARIYSALSVAVHTPSRLKIGTPFGRDISGQSWRPRDYHYHSNQGRGEVMAEVCCMTPAIIHDGKLILSAHSIMKIFFSFHI